jgi:hypothetical protein
MRKDTRFRRPERVEIEAKLPPGSLSDAAALGVWNMMLQSDDPSEVSRWYRNYRDSEHCSVPKKNLRAMRDTMIKSMRDANREDPKPRKEKKKGVHYNGHNDGWLPQRKGA